MTDELREKLEAMKATLESLLERDARSLSQLYIARLMDDGSREGGSVVILHGPPDVEGDWKVAGGAICGQYGWVPDGEVDVICTIEDVLMAWEERENKND